MSKAIKEGMTTSAWYMGFSWYDPITNSIIAYPIPLNLIMRFFRWLYLAVAFPRLTTLDAYIRNAVIAEKGKFYAEGKAHGIVIGRNQIYDELKAEIKRSRES